MERERTISQNKKALLLIVAAMIIVALVQLSCSISFGKPATETPDMMATGVAQTLTASAGSQDDQNDQQDGQDGQSTSLTPTPTPTLTITPTEKATTQAAQQQGQQSKPSSPTPTRTKAPTTAVPPKAAAEITSFTIDKSSFSQSETANLKWETKNADKVTLSYDGGAEVDVSKSSSGFAIPGNSVVIGKHTATLKATGGGKTVTSSVAFEVVNPAEITSFTIDKSTFNQSETAYFKWETKNADTVTLNYDGGADVAVNKTSNGFAVQGNSVSIGKHTANLKATGGGKTVTSSVAFEVVAQPTAPVITSYTLDKSCLHVDEILTLNWAVTGANTVQVDIYMINDPNPIMTRTNISSPYTIGYGYFASGGENVVTLTATNGAGSVSEERYVGVPCQ